MAANTDQDLLRAYARSRDEDAFAELVHRHLDMVYSTALRVVREASLAEDVAQRVFLSVAQHASRLQERSSLTGWLYESSRNFAVSTVRSEERRRRREAEVATMEKPIAIETNNPWPLIEPLLDQALQQLSASERELVVFRYFERLTAEQIGERLGVTGEAAQKRISRALERMRDHFRERSVTTTTIGLAALLSTHAVQSAPVGLAASAIANVTAASASLPSINALGVLMTSLKTKLGLAAVIVAITAVPLVLEHRRNSKLLEDLSLLQSQGEQVDQLREEVQRLASEAQAAALQRGEARTELARLRSELSALRTRQNASMPSPNANPGSSRKRADVPSDRDALIPAAQWSNVGHEAPASTLQTLEWAKAKQDTNVIARSLAWADEHSRTEIEAIFAAAPESVHSRYGSADAFVLGLFNQSGPLDARHRVDAYRIVEERIGEDEATLQIEFHYGDGSTHTGPMRYVRMDNEWRQALDFNASEQNKLNSSLQQAPETPSP